MIDRDKAMQARREITAMLAALERQLHDAITLAAGAQSSANHESLSAFMRFRDKTVEFKSLLALIEERVGGLEDMTGQSLDTLRANFGRLEMLMVSLVVRGTKGFLAMLLNSDAVPLGAREVLLPEVQTLREIAEKLKRPDYAARLGAGMARNLEETVMLLKQVTDRVPALPEFDETPVNQVRRDANRRRDLF